MGYSPTGWLMRAVPEQCDSSGVGGGAQQWCWCWDRRGLATGQKDQPPVLAGVVCPGAGGKAQLQDEWQARMMWAWGRVEGDRIQGNPCTVLLAGGLLTHSGWCVLSLCGLGLLGRSLLGVVERAQQRGPGTGWDNMGLEKGHSPILVGVAWALPYPL